jgi:CheY-like chemotaxis protein
MSYRILAVDDHPQTLDIVIITLQQHGFQAMGLNSPVDVVTIAEQERPHLILLDMNMPEMDGSEVCRQLRAHPELSSIPIIMFSAEASEKLAGFQAGADDFLLKPTDPEELIARIEALLESSGAVEDESESTAAESPMGVGVPSLGGLSPLPKDSKLIAVTGVRGGSGATTLAMNLAVGSAMAGFGTTLVDLDVLQGHVGRYLKQKLSRHINALAQLPDDELAVHLPEQLITYRDNLNLLLVNPNVAGAYLVPSPKQIAIIINALMRSNRCVVVDLGHEINSLARVVLEGADEVIICLRPERVSLASARELVQFLEKILYPHTALRAIMFGVIGGMKLPKKAVEGFLGRPLLAIIPAQPQRMLNAMNKGLAFVELYPETKVAQAFQLIARRLVETPKRLARK